MGYILICFVIGAFILFVGISISDLNERFDCMKEIAENFCGNLGLDFSEGYEDNRFNCFNNVSRELIGPFKFGKDEC